MAKDNVAVLSSGREITVGDTVTIKAEWLNVGESTATKYVVREANENAVMISLLGAPNAGTILDPVEMVSAETLI